MNTSVPGVCWRS